MTNYLFELTLYISISTNYWPTKLAFHFICIYSFQIALIGFPAHTTHLLQPLDVGVFAEVKKNDNAIVVAAGARSTKSRITKSYFPTTWSNALKQAASVKLIQSAFRRTGLSPFDPTALDTSKIKKRK